MRNSILCLMLLACTSCGILDYPMSVYDEVTGRTIEVPLGDIVASSAEPVGTTVATTVTGLTGGNALIGAAFGAAATALLGGAARSRKKKVVPVTEGEATPA